MRSLVPPANSTSPPVASTGPQLNDGRLVVHTFLPVSFQVDGKQYIAVQSGWGVDPAKMQARMNLLFPGKYPEVPQGGAVYVFAVK